MRLALREVRRRPRRTVLAVLGVAAGSCAYMLFVGSAQGLLRQFHAVSSFFGADFIVQQAGATSPWSSAISATQVERVRQTRGLAHVSRIGLGKTKVLGTPYFLVFGLDPDEELMARVPLQSGRPPRPGADEILLGSRAAARLRATVLTTVEVRGRRLTVTGVYRTGHTLLDAGGVLGLGQTQRLFNLNESVNLAFLDLNGEVEAEAVARELARTLPDVEVLPARGWGESYGPLRLVEDFAKVTSGLAVLIAAFCVSIVLHASVAERTGELAVLRAIGWSRGRVAVLILVENLVITLLGVATAVLLSELVLSLVRSARVGSTFAEAFLPPHVSARLALEALAVSAGAAFLGTLAPLLRAVRIRPADALRGV